VKSKKTYLIIGVISVLLISLLINQIAYVYDAAAKQEVYFNNRAQIALDSIVKEVSGDYKVYQSVKKCFNPNNGKGIYGSWQKSYCRTDLISQNEWGRVDAIIKSELHDADIELRYNFDFCTPINNVPAPKGKNTFTKQLDRDLAKSAIVMHLEFPSKSKYLLKQIGPAFVSSILIILLLSIVFIVLLGYYKKEKRNAERTKYFLNNMTHEFKTPLANIAFANSFLKRKSDDITPETVKKYTAIIQSENEKIINSSEDILELAKQEYDFSKLETEDVNIHHIICDLQQSFKASYMDIELEISLRLEARNHVLSGKSSFLYNALSNILDNAIKYCERNPSILISTNNKNNQLFISIEDNGIGIPRNEQKSIFEKFYRIATGNLHNIKGFGLGLAYVKMIVQQLNGTISIQSELGAGSIFTLKLPL